MHAPAPPAGRICNTYYLTGPKAILQHGQNHDARLTIGFEGVAPSSLGRVKSLFR
jgi:hypothetical protein